MASSSTGPIAVTTDSALFDLVDQAGVTVASFLVPREACGLPPDGLNPS
jgi:hypothetical protein